jgi:hypothetical protein
MTAVSLTPNGTITAGTIEGGAATSHGAVTDASDATAILLGGPCEWTLSTFTLPAGGVVKSANVSVRGRGSVSGWTLAATLRNAASQVVASYSIPLPLGTNGNVVATPAAITVSDQPTVDGLQLYLQNPNAAGGANYYLHVVEISVPLVYVVPPTVTVTAPTGSITTATTTVVWTYTGDVDADASGVQQRYQMKVFTAAQYGAGGFDPATSAPFYNSGEVTTSATSATVGPLLNTVTYKAYVRAAQNVNGARQWSAWAAGPAFTNNTDPPAVLTIAAAVSASAVQVTVTRDVAHTNWTHLNLERSVGDLLSWEPVRGALELATTGNTMVVPDYEMPEGVAVWYRARGIVKTGTAVTAQGAWKVTSAAVTWTTTGCGEYLRDPADPTTAMLIEVVVDDQTMATEHRVGLLDVIGRASPVTVWDTPNLPTGMLPIVTRTYADAVALNDLVRTAPVLLWQGRRSWGHPQSWIVITGHTTTRAATSDAAYADYREWELTYVEVDEPPVLS